MKNNKMLLVSNPVVYQTFLVTAVQLKGESDVR